MRDGIVLTSRTFILINVACAAAAGFLLGWSAGIGHVGAILRAHFNNVADPLPREMVTAAEIPHAGSIVIAILVVWLCVVGVAARRAARAPRR